ncbi:MAG: DUF2085 domain-containing protein [Coriobacteriales bacterium]|jgi:uncharacterized membrane protein|nr:DUF2085 domain-containing protein [Coriobacteriales bacterium]
MQDILTFIGHGFCHQIPERTFMSGGLYFAVCARDTGLHLGLALAVICAFVLYARARIKPGDMPPALVVVILALMVVPMAFDGVTSYAGLRPTTNTIRFITGLLAGVGVGTLLAPFLIGLRRDADADLKAFTRPAITAAQLLAPVIAGLIFLVGFPLLGPIAPFIEAAAFVGAVLSVNLLLLSLSARLRPTGSIRRWLVVGGLAFVLAAGEISLAAFVRELLFSFLLG